MANNNQRLIDSSYQNKEQALYLMTLPNGMPNKISLSNGRASNGHWSKDDSKVVYLYTNKTTCQFHQIDFINGQAQPPRSIYQCNKNSQSNFAYSNDNHDFDFSPETGRFLLLSDQTPGNTIF
jgi:Tol biopolymer transport system component